MVGFPGGTSGKEPACQFRRCRRREFDPWRRKLQPTPVFLPGKSHGWGAWQSAVHGAAKSHTQLKHSVCTHNNGTFLQGALVFAWQGYCHFKSKDYIKTHDLACDLLWGVLFQWVSPWGVPLGALQFTVETVSCLTLNFTKELSFLSEASYNKGFIFWEN